MKDKGLIPQLSLLCQLQEIDLQIKQVKEEISQIPRKIKEWKGELVEREEKIKELKKKREELIIQGKEKELELGSKEEITKKYQGQLYTTKTNKEYSSLLHEIEETKRVSSQMEDEILMSMEKIEVEEESIRKESKELEEKSKEIEIEEQKENKRLKGLEENLKDKQAERNKFIPGIDNTLLAKYERIFQAKGGVALVPVIGGSCGGCHVQLTPQNVQIVKQGGKPTICEGCARILYWKENLEQPKG